MSDNCPVCGGSYIVLGGPVVANRICQCAGGINDLNPPNAGQSEATLADLERLTRAVAYVWTNWPDMRIYHEGLDEPDDALTGDAQNMRDALQALKDVAETHLRGLLIAEAEKGKVKP